MTDVFGTDLFGHGQGSLFGDAEDRIPHPQRPAHDADRLPRVRRKLHAALETARNAQTPPWSEKEFRNWQIVFPQMANWLPDEEADQLRFEFAREVERLKLAA